MTTYERVENINLKVVKKSGKVEDYSRAKLEKMFGKTFESGKTRKGKNC
jgi:transcriptional regulator NrdR family protein